MELYLIWTLCASVAVAAQNSTSPLPQSIQEHVVGWRSSADRGTLDIIESCLATIIACTWSIQHLNLPGKEDKDKNKGWTKLVRSCKWMLVTVFLPEFIMAHALFEFVIAWQAMSQMTSRRTVRYPRWYSAFQEDSESPPPWTLTHCYFANMGGFWYDDGQSHFPVTADQLAKQWDLIDMPNISEEDIKDKSKTDYFAKAIAILQISQLVVSLIARRIKQLHFSQLETITLVFAVCGIITYTIYWYKPQNVETPIIIKCRDGEHLRFSKTFDSFWEILTNKSNVYPCVARVPPCREQHVV
jgi:hypothetical protein